MYVYFFLFQPVRNTWRLTGTIIAQDAYLVWNPCPSSEILSAVRKRIHVWCLWRRSCRMPSLHTPLQVYTTVNFVSEGKDLAQKPGWNAAMLESQELQYHYMVTIKDSIGNHGLDLRFGHES